MIRHGLLNWGIYAHLILLPVPPNLSLYVSFVLIITSLSVLIPKLTVGGYLYLKFINFYKSKLEQYLMPPGFSTSETQDEMATMIFSLLAGTPLSPKASTLYTTTGYISFHRLTIHQIVSGVGWEYV